MEKKYDPSENTDEVKMPADAANDIEDIGATKIISTMPSSAPEAVEKSAPDPNFMTAPDLDDAPVSGEFTQASPDEAESESPVEDSTADIADTAEEADSADNTVIITKSVIDEETVEQLVENRIPKKTSDEERSMVPKKKKKKKKKKNYALKTLIVILAFILVFIVSFLLARTFFTLDADNNSTETQKADDISMKAEDEEKSADEKTIVPESSDGATAIDESAYATEDDNTSDNKNTGKDTNKDTSKDSNKQSDDKKDNNTDNKNGSSANSGKNNDSNKNTTPSTGSSDDDGEIILPGTPSDEDEGSENVGIVID